MLDDAANVDPSEHPDTVMSAAVKSLVASLDVKLSAIAAVLVDAPLDTALEAIVIPSAVLSYVHV